MGEYADAWASAYKKNIFDQVVDVVEMQSEAGAAGAVSWFAIRRKYDYYFYCFPRFAFDDSKYV